MTNKVNTVLYVGVTNNLDKRVYEHKLKLIPGFTVKYNIHRLEVISKPPLSSLRRQGSI